MKEGCASTLANVNKWFILLDYSLGEEEFDNAVFDNYQMIILDADSYPDFSGTNRENKKILAYVSLGEAEDYRAYWEKINQKAWVFSLNEDWEGNYPVDVRSGEWQDIILNEVIPEIVRKGFDGLFLDTIDTAEWLEETFPEQFPGAKKSMADLIIKIRKMYPDLVIVTNNGLTVINDDEVYSLIDGILVEDVNMMIDFENGGYRKAPNEIKKEIIAFIKEMNKKRNLPVFNIDYTYINDVKSVKYCLRESKKLGYLPYIAQKELDQVYVTET
ncbi:MAG: endo alpha-1,4 polygalactosaminidase [Candidatus Omnitrophica bacterium]|nr:endo alpha-1,4 polygalactosaminidase [Candidatus Omnitrophota bacterium]